MNGPSIPIPDGIGIRIVPHRRIQIGLPPSDPNPHMGSIGSIVRSQRPFARLPPPALQDVDFEVPHALSER